MTWLEVDPALTLEWDPAKTNPNLKMTGLVLSNPASNNYRMSLVSGAIPKQGTFEFSVKILHASGYDDVFIGVVPPDFKYAT